MAKYKVNCDSLDEAKKLDKRVSGKGATNVVRGLDMMGGRTGYFVEFDFAGPVESLGIGPLAIKKIKDTSDSAEVMKKFTFECEQYWYPSSTWEKKTKVIEAENESDAKMQLMHGGISKVRNVRLIKVSDSSVSAVGDASTISANGLQKGWYVSSDVRTPDKLDGKIVTKRMYESKGKKRVTGTTVLPDGSTGYFDYGYTEQVKFSSNLQDSALRDDSTFVKDGVAWNGNYRVSYHSGWKTFEYGVAGNSTPYSRETFVKMFGESKVAEMERQAKEDEARSRERHFSGLSPNSRKYDSDCTFVKDGVFENAMKRWGFIGSTDDNYKKGTTYIDLDNNGVYDKARLIGYFTNMTDLEQMLKHIGAIHDSMHFTDGTGKMIPVTELSYRDKFMFEGIEYVYDRTSRHPNNAFVLVHCFAPNGMRKSFQIDLDEKIKLLDSISSEVTDGKIVGGEGRSMDGIPWGLYQEGGRSYRGFEITSSENGLRKGFYRFYNWGDGYGVPFGNSAVDGQFTEAQFQRLIGEGKVKLLDSVGYFGDAEISHNDVELVKKIDEASQLQINDAGWFDLTTIELQDSSELTLTKLVTDVKKAVRRTVAEITNGRFDAGILRLQVLVKDNMSNKFNWMELPISYRLSYDVLLKLHAESEYKIKKAQSELNAKLKQFAGKQLYKDKSIVSDSFILIDDATVNCNKFEILAKESGANFHNISNTKKDGVTYMKFVSSAPEAEQERSVNWLRSVLEGQEGSGVLSWGMRGTSRGEMSVMIKDAVTKADLKNKSTAELREILAQGMDEWEESIEERAKTFKAVKAELTKRGVKDAKRFKKGDKVIVLRGGSKGKEGEIIETGGGQYDVKIGEKVIYLGVDDLKLKDSKMFKVVDKATGKTLLVKATDSLAAVKRVSSLKDATKLRYELITIKNGETDSDFVEAGSQEEALDILSGRARGRRLELGVHQNGTYKILKSWK